MIMNKRQLKKFNKKFKCKTFERYKFRKMLRCDKTINYKTFSECILSVGNGTIRNKVNFEDLPEIKLSDPIEYVLELKNVEIGSELVDRFNEIKENMNI